MQEIYGLIGDPVGHSLSPVMMNTAFDVTNMHARYFAFPIAPKNLVTALDGMRVLGFRGVNVTIPHKEAVFRALDHVSAEAGLAKAVNTLVPEADGGWTGHNTDVEGWWSSFSEGGQPKPTSVVTVLGAGGAARAVLAGLSVHAAGASVLLVARRAGQAIQLQEEFKSHLEIDVGEWQDRHRELERADFIVNTTPMGMWPSIEVSVLDDESCLHTGQVVQDLVYRPLVTKLLEQAARRGATVVDGARMLVGQGARAFELWTAHTAPVADMRKAVLERLVEAN
ncbi:shikimate dehydrogenase [Alicyclobacillus curvatus]|nr:shikimate dehydrogenase [Alicyclobacillus curvatus]